MDHSLGSAITKSRAKVALLAAAAVIAASCSSGEVTGAAVKNSTAPTVSAGASADSDAGAATPGGSGDFSVADENPVSGQGISVVDKFIANVTTAAGSPVPWPEINGRTGDSQGQVTGPADASGWYEVRAPGYATTFARPVAASGGYDILDVESTPLSSPIVIDGSEKRIEVAEGASVTVPAGALPAGTWLTVTELPGRHLSAPWAPVEGGYRTRVFSFDSTAEDGTSVQPTAALTLHIDDASTFGGASTLATFEPESGTWAQTAECTVSGVAIDCAVPHFSLSTPVGGEPYPPSNNDNSGASGDSQASQDRAEQLQDMIDDQEKAADELPSRIEGLLDAAAGAARSGPSRATKDRLASMIVVANAYDLDTSAAVGALGAAYKAVASKVIDAARQAKKPRCSFLAALVGVVAEGEMVASVGASNSPMQEAVDLASEIEIECRYLWTGTIEYRFPAPDQWEIYSAGSTTDGARYQDRGIDDWVETASVMMTVDLDSGRLEGTISDSPGFVPLRFRLDLNVPDQACPGDYWEEFTVEGVGSGEPRVGTGEVSDLVERAASGTVQIPLEFDGTYQSEQFSVSQPHLVGGSGLRIQTRVDINSFIVPCEGISGSTVDEDFVVEPYSTQLVDGFGFMSPIDPTVTLNEMLRSPQRTEPDGRIVIEGRRKLTVGLDLAVPFKEGTLTWKFSTDSLFENYGDGG